MTTDDAQGEELVASRVVRNYPDWRTMEGIGTRRGEPDKGIAGRTRRREGARRCPRKVVDSWAILAWLQGNDCEPRFPPCSACACAEWLRRVTIDFGAT
jgi:hypothetical protein